MSRFGVFRRYGAAWLLAALLPASGARAQQPDAAAYLAAMPPEARLEALARVVRDADYRCDTPVQQFYAGGVRGREAWWDLRCDRGVAFRIRVRSWEDGSIVPCDTMSRMARSNGLRVECFEPIPPEMQSTGGAPPPRRRL